jgi:predicted ATP-grasp superfamily ATP-dependent carboligase
VRVYVVDSRRGSPASRSRYCAGSYIWDFLAAAEADTIAFLMDLGKSLGPGCLLFPTCDENAILAASHHKELSKWFAYPAQAPELARSLVSKKEMYFLAKQHGVPVPQTSFPQTMDEVLAFSHTARFPTVAKGIDGARLKRALGAGVIIAQNEADLLDLYSRLDESDYCNLMLQEYIPGGDDCVWMFNGYFDSSSECLFGITGKKIRQYPAYTGQTSLGICLSNNIVYETTVRWMKALGYKGILDIGYRYDTRDGQYKVLDVNPRIGATFRLFVDRAGMDVARAFYLDFVAQPVPSAPARENRKWIVEDCDIGSSLRYWRDGKLGCGRWLRSLGGIEEAAYFALDDIVPFWNMCLRSLQVKFQIKSATHCKTSLSSAKDTAVLATHV